MSRPKEIIYFVNENRKIKIVTISQTYYMKQKISTLTNLLKKTGWKFDKLNGILSTINSVNPWAVTQIVLREIAIELDKKYKDHINKSEEIYAISPQDGRIHKINKKTIKNYRAFPAFRNVEDAKIACSLVRENLKSIFANV